jgi:four helix bundle protein
MQDYRKRVAWERAHKLTLSVYRSTAQFPIQERLGLQSQRRRAAICVLANVAEGLSRRAQKDFARYLDVAIGALKELQSFILPDLELSCLGSNAGAVLHNQTDQVFAPLSGLLKKMEGASELAPQTS